MQNLQPVNHSHRHVQSSGEYFSKHDLFKIERRRRNVKGQKFFLILARRYRKLFVCHAITTSRLVGIGSTFNEKDFTEHSDIDVVVFGLHNPDGPCRRAGTKQKKLSVSGFYESPGLKI
jgi:hypothetical protein